MDQYPMSGERAKPRERRCTTMERVCPYCGRTFLAAVCEVRRGGGQYCSMACVYKSRQKRGKEYALRFFNPVRRRWYRRWISPETGKTISQLEHRWLWEMTFGEISPGLVVHHIDGDQQNNDLHNLVLATVGEHAAIHREMRKRYGEDGQPLKQCPACGEYKPLSEFFCGRNDLPTGRCRPCRREYEREYHHERKSRREIAEGIVIKRGGSKSCQDGRGHRQKSPVIDVDCLTLKKCTTCGEFKPLDEFYERKDGVKTPPCKECVKKHCKEYGEKKRMERQHVGT